ncbi:hypothetical protein C943_00055 [Mariniradius saccharolyticus AK6]|uniref:Uncharacterized protein n=1 Tax=Mariniradius saccharolyticus AK6 TaxID=1239962 RepID=M7Y3G6_9BACT|nr:hypothetical protein C943_00055 [Mariniradius saccharolyticus AK6]
MIIFMKKHSWFSDFQLFAIGVKLFALGYSLIFGINSLLAIV